MNDKRRKCWLYLGTAVLGAGCMWIQKRILATGFDAQNLMKPGNPLVWGLWAVAAVYLAAALVLARRLETPGSYEENFPACPWAGGCMALAGLVMAWSGIDRLMPGQMGDALGAVVCGGLMMLCGGARFLGRRPHWALEAGIVVFYALGLVSGYTKHSVDTRLQRYAFGVLAQAAVMLFTLHRGRFAQKWAEPRRMAFFGFAGMLLCAIAMARYGERLYYLASWLWCAGGMGNLAVCRQDKPGRT